MTRRPNRWIELASLAAPLMTGCAVTASTSSQSAPSPVVSAAASGTIVSFRQGIAPGHAANSSATIKAVRGSTVLADISAQVTMRVSFPVPPGPFTVTVDGVDPMTGTSGSSGTQSGSSGTGCPLA